MENWTFTATPELVATLGEKWGGTYEVKLLMADEYLGIGEEYADDLRKKGKEIIKPEDFKQSEFHMRLLRKSVLHNSKSIEKNLPAKLIELLMPLVLRRNTMSIMEKQEDFLSSGTPASQT